MLLLYRPVAGRAFTNPAADGGMTLGWFSSPERRRRVRQCRTRLPRRHPAARAASAMRSSLITPMQRRDPYRWMGSRNLGTPSRSGTPAALLNDVPCNPSLASMSATNPSYTLPSAMQTNHPGTCTSSTTSSSPFESHQSGPLWGDLSRLPPIATPLQEQQSVASDLHGHISVPQIC